MSTRRLMLIALIFAVPLLIYLLWPTDEKRIRKLFKEGAKALELQQTEEVMSKISFNYTDERGLSYLFLKDGVARFFKQLKDIKVEYEITKILVTKDKAQAALEIRIIASRGKETGYIVGDAAKPLQMKFDLEKERTTWLIVKTEGLPHGY